MNSGGKFETESTQQKVSRDFSMPLFSISSSTYVGEDSLLTLVAGPFVPISVAGCCSSGIRGCLDVDKSPSASPTFSGEELSRGLFKLGWSIVDSMIVQFYVRQIICGRHRLLFDIPSSKSRIRSVDPWRPSFVRHFPARFKATQRQNKHSLRTHHERNYHPMLRDLRLWHQELESEDSTIIVSQYDAKTISSTSRIRNFGILCRI